LPDPQDEATYSRAKLNHHLRRDEQHRVLLKFYKQLIQLRKETPALVYLSKDNMDIRAIEEHKLLFLHRWKGDNEVMALFNLNNNQTSVTLPIPVGCWRKRLDSAEKHWRGKGSTVPEQLNSKREGSLAFTPWAFALFIKET